MNIVFVMKHSILLNYSLIYLNINCKKCLHPFFIFVKCYQIPHKCVSYILELVFFPFSNN